MISKINNNIHEPPYHILFTTGWISEFKIKHNLKSYFIINRRKIGRKSIQMNLRVERAIGLDGPIIWSPRLQRPRLEPKNLTREIFLLFIWNLFSGPIQPSIIIFLNDNETEF